MCVCVCVCVWTCCNDSLQAEAGVFITGLVLACAAVGAVSVLIAKELRGRHRHAKMMLVRDRDSVGNRWTPARSARGGDGGDGTGDGDGAGYLDVQGSTKYSLFGPTGTSNL